jgi:hypothetical protein
MVECQQKSKQQTHQKPEPSLYMSTECLIREPLTSGAVTGTLQNCNPVTARAWLCKCDFMTMTKHRRKRIHIKAMSLSNGSRPRNESFVMASCWNSIVEKRQARLQCVDIFYKILHEAIDYLCCYSCSILVFPLDGCLQFLVCLSCSTVAFFSTSILCNMTSVTSR